MCTLSITHYEADVGGEHQPLTRSPGPIIIGQEDSALDKAFSNMSVNGYRQPNGFQYARNSSSYQTNLSARPLGDRKEASVLHTPPAFGSIAAGYGTAAVSLSSPTWSPNSDSYNGYGTSSALWSPYSPGTIGQERGSAIFPSQRRTLQHQQPRVHVRFSGRHQHEFSAVHHNVVDVDRIQAGLDVRTTVRIDPYNAYVSADDIFRSCYAIYQTKSTRSVVLTVRTIMKLTTLENAQRDC